MSERELRLADERDIPTLKSLWAAAFPDEDATDIDAFFDRFFNMCAVPLVCENGTAVSMLFLIPQRLRCPSTVVSTAYIYAGATRTDRRGRGLYRLLLTYAEQVARKNGVQALFLRPASARLEESYRRMGFTVPMCCDCTDVQGDGDITFSEMSAAAYAERRRFLLDRLTVPYVDWDEAVIAHAQRWCRTVSCGEGACALVARDNGRIWEYLSTDATVRWPFAVRACRFPGSSTTIGLLKPLDDMDALKSSPLYMGYGLE